jgi:hypothetical protein
MTESKKAWVTPELIVLVRSKPEEAVLITCKYGGGGAGPGPGVVAFTCCYTGTFPCGSYCDVSASS